MNSKINYNAAYDLIKNNLENNPEKTAFIDENNSISYEQLYIKIKSFASSLNDIGISKKDRVLICLNDSINYPISFLGCIWAGVIPICINTMLPKNDYQYMINDSEAKAIIFSNSHLEIFKTLISDNNLNITLISEDESNFISLSKLLKNNKLEEQPILVDENNVCFWLYSSGSTGNPKGTIHIHRNLKATSKTYAENILKINNKDICYSAAKLFFAYGLGNALTFPMSVGATSILSSQRPTNVLVAEVIKKHKVTLFFGVPTLYASILNLDLDIKNYSTLRLCISAGEALPKHLYYKWLKLLKLKILDGIGSTEMLHIFISNTKTKVYPGSSGKPVPGYNAKLVNEKGQEAEVNEIGELYVQGPSSAIQYWNKPEKTNSTFIDGWTKTGDKYTKNKYGVYTYCGRADDMMKVSGQYVSPFEVETALQSHKSVLEAAVVANQDNDLLIKPKAFIILNKSYYPSDALKKELTIHVKKNLTPFKYPRWYEFVESLPKTATGKIQRYKLRKNI